MKMHTILAQYKKHNDAIDALAQNLKALYANRDEAQQEALPIWVEIVGLDPEKVLDTKSTGRVVWVKDAKGVEAAKKALNRLLARAYDEGKGGSGETDPVAQAIKVCAKLSWSEWDKVVKAIEATR